MQMKQSQDRVASCTTTHFDGVIAVIDPEASWVARWQRTCVLIYSLLQIEAMLKTLVHLIAKYVRGMYAVRVKGRIPEDVEQELNERAIRYRPRDQTDQD